MTDSEKLDFLIERVTSLDKKVADLQKDMTDVKADLLQLHHDDNLILDEVERVLAY